MMIQLVKNPILNQPGLNGISITANHHLLRSQARAHWLSWLQWRWRRHRVFSRGAVSINGSTPLSLDGSGWFFGENPII